MEAAHKKMLKRIIAQLAIIAGSGGGGGGSGYQDGSVTVVDTKLGGSTGNAKVVLRLQS